jgi:hypothetical protein
MLQPGVEDFFDPAELGTPSVAHVVKTTVNVGAQFRNTRVHISQTRIVDQDPDEYNDNG